MVHEVIPCSCKICDWSLNSFRDHLGLRQEKQCKSEVTKRLIFGPISIIVVVQWVCNGKRLSCCKCQGTMVEKCHFKDVLPNVFHSYKERREVEGEKVKHEENFQICHCWAYIGKNQHIHFLVYGHFSWSTFNLHLVMGPKDLRMHLKKIGPWKNAL